MGSECGAKFVRAGAPRSLRDDGETSVLINQSINQSQHSASSTTSAAGSRQILSSTPMADLAFGLV